MKNEASFSILDYVLFGLTLFVSAAIGLFYAIRSCRRREGTDEFLLGGRRMPLLPTAISLLVSFVSGISIVAYPAEVFTMGAASMWTIVAACASIIFSGVFIMPIFYPIKSASIYVYLQKRFDSKILRLYGSILFQLSTLVYMSVVLYAPSVALTGVTGLDLWVLLLSVGVVCTLYTAVGGLKAVVWTDTFQAVVMYAGLLALAIRGTMKAGGFAKVFTVASEYGRLKGFLNTDPDPLQYMTVWSAFFGGFFYWLSSFGSNQTALQRYCSLPTMTKARLAIFFNVPCMLSIMGLVFYIGLTMTSYYVQCNPLIWDKSIVKDQLVIYYMLDMLKDIYGLPGLFVACIFSGTLSTVSSGINSLSAVFLEDVVKLVCNADKLTERRATAITKIVAWCYGAIAVALAFAAGPLGGAYKAVSSGLGALNGPLVGLILLGIFFPCANWKGGLTGALAGTSVNLWIFAGTMVYSVKYPQLATYTSACDWRNDTLTTASMSSVSDFANFSLSTPFGEKIVAHKFSPDMQGISKIYALSFIMYACVGAVVTISTGVVVSLLTGCSDVTKRNPELVFWTLSRARKEAKERKARGERQNLWDAREIRMPSMESRSDAVYSF